jgi:TIR domain
VAGIAACPNTSEILSMFAEFIKTAVATVKAWQPPPATPAGRNPEDRDPSGRPGAGTGEVWSHPDTARAQEAARGEDTQASRVSGSSGVQLGSGNLQFNDFYASPEWTGDSGTQPAPPSSGIASVPSQGHVFLSYVREDSAEVDAPQKRLEAAGFPVWRDTSSLGPGESWRSKIRGAISRDALVFIA